MERTITGKHARFSHVKTTYLTMMRHYPKDYISLQIHITEACKRHCRFCYMFDETYDQRLQDELQLEDWKNILTDFKNYTQTYQKEGLIMLTGGDPLLSPFFFDLVDFIEASGFRWGIMGNPFDDDDLLDRLSKTNMVMYQVSLDGLEKTHNYFRGVNDFEKTVQFINRSAGRFGINVQTMFTLSKENKDEFLPLVSFLAHETLTSSIRFSRLCPTGDGEDFIQKQVTTEEYHQLLLDYYFLYRDLLGENSYVHLGFKESELFPPLYYQLGLYKTNLFSNQSQTIQWGCYVGQIGFAILSDGTAMGCRRMPTSLFAKYPENLFHAYEDPNQLKPFRNRLQWEKCFSCKLKHWCNGCPSVKAAGENIESADSNCFFDVESHF